MRTTSPCGSYGWAGLGWRYWDTQNWRSQTQRVDTFYAVEVGYGNIVRKFYALWHTSSRDAFYISDNINSNLIDLVGISCNYGIVCLVRFYLGTTLALFYYTYLVFAKEMTWLRSPDYRPKKQQKKIQTILYPNKEGAVGKGSRIFPKILPTNAMIV